MLILIDSLIRITVANSVFIVRELLHWQLFYGSFKLWKDSFTAFSFPFCFYLFFFFLSKNINGNSSCQTSGDSCLPLSPQSVSQSVCKCDSEVIFLILCCIATLCGATKLQMYKHEGLQCTEIILLSELLLARISAFSAEVVRDRRTNWQATHENRCLIIPGCLLW